MDVMRGDKLSKEVILEKYLINMANYTHVLFEVELTSHKNKSTSPQKVRISTIRRPEVIATPAQLKENAVRVDGETRVEGGESGLGATVALRAGGGSKAIGWTGESPPR